LFCRSLLRVQFVITLFPQSTCPSVPLWPNWVCFAQSVPGYQPVLTEVASFVQPVLGHRSSGPPIGFVSSQGRPPSLPDPAIGFVCTTGARPASSPNWVCFARIGVGVEYWNDGVKEIIVFLFYWCDCRNSLSQAFAANEVQPRNTPNINRGFRPHPDLLSPKPALSEVEGTRSTPRRQDCEALNLCGLGVFARNVIPWISRSYAQFSSLGASSPIRRRLSMPVCYLKTQNKANIFAAGPAYPRRAWSGLRPQPKPTCAEAQRQARLKSLGTLRPPSAALRAGSASLRET
jgi:hypothetical protein